MSLVFSSMLKLCEQLQAAGPVGPGPGPAATGPSFGLAAVQQCSSLPGPTGSGPADLD